jgi:hypothetical protein
MMGKPNTILEFFKRKNAQNSNANVGDASLPTSDIVVSEIFSKNLEELMSINLVLVRWSLFLDYIVKYGSIMLINEMKFDELTLKLVCTN